MKTLYFLVCILALTGCKSNLDNNAPLEYETLSVNFRVNTAEFEMPANSTYGIAAYCSRNDQQDFRMNSGSHTSRYNSSETGVSSDLIKNDESDQITAQAGDQNFKFYACYPYRDVVDFTAVPAAVPAVQYYDAGVASYLTFTAFTRKTSIIPTTNLDFRTPFLVLNLSIPSDIMEEGKPSILKSITIYPAQSENFSGILSGEGTINAESGVFTMSPNNRSTSIKLEFPSEGLTLQGQEISVVTLPFENPKGGFIIEFEDINGESYQSSFLNQSSDEGVYYEPGTIAQINVTRDSDGVIPVNFPVKFLLGKVNDVPRFTNTSQPKWMTSGLWTSADQPQAYVQWNKVSTPSPNFDQVREIVNSGDISTPGVKGIWTGDYYEFTIPVKNLDANSKIRMDFPFYGRLQPVFWNVKYQDGEEWKLVNPHLETSYDNKFTRECTFSLEFDVIKLCSFTVNIENEIKSGYLKFRLECADGSIVALNSTTTEEVAMPYANASGYTAPCYFRTDRGVAMKEISFTLVQ